MIRTDKQYYIQMAQEASDKVDRDIEQKIKQVSCAKWVRRSRQFCSILGCVVLCCSSIVIPGIILSNDQTHQPAVTPVAAHKSIPQSTYHYNPYDDEDVVIYRRTTFITYSFSFGPAGNYSSGGVFGN